MSDEKNIHKRVENVKKGSVIACLLLVVFTLAGCMYPDEKLTQNQVPYEDQLTAVQVAVDKYREDNGGLLPIKTKDADTPVYEKYPIDFERLVPKYLSDVPGNAFESGGIFQYVLIEVETTPLVKIFDLRIAEQIRELNMLINLEQYPPYKAEVAKGVFTLDYSKLGYKQDPVAESPYTHQNLPFVITGTGEIFVDYQSDLYQKMKEFNVDLKAGEDIRWILVQDSMFVPAYSLEYTVDKETNEPFLLVK